MKRWSAALAVALAGTAVAGTGANAASKPAAGKYGGEITVGIGDSFPAWCVANIPNHSALGGFRLIFEQLFERTPAGEYVGSLAESGTPSADFKTWTVKLRSGIKFHNGEDFNAEAVKLNVDMNSGWYMTPGNTAGNATYTAGYYSTGVGVNANIVSVAVVDPLTVQFNLDRGQNDFLGTMYRAGRYVMRAPAQLKDKATCGNNPIGTGPFKWVSNTADELIVAKNPNYWRTHPVNGDKLPYLDKVTFVNIKEPSQRAAAVRKGTVDMASFATGDATFVKGLQSQKSKVTEYKSQMLWWGQWMPNVNKPGSPFKFKNCRLAAAYSIDWNAYNKVRLKGMGLYNRSIVAKSHPMYTLAGAPKFDLAKAKEYLTACNTDLGAAAPMKITLYADTSTQSQNNVKFLRQQMAAAGIQFNNDYIAEATVLISKIYNATKGSNDFDFAQGTPAEGGDAAYVVPFFLSKAFPANAKSPVAAGSVGKFFNTVIALGNHGDTKVDDLIYAAQADPNPRTAKWKAATEYLQAEGYTIPSIHSTFYSFVNKKSNLGGIGKLPIGLTKNKFPSVVTNKGFDITGIWKK